MNDLDEMIYRYVDEPQRWGQRYSLHRKDDAAIDKLIDADDTGLFRAFDSLWQEYLLRDVPTYVEPAPVSGEIEWR